MVGVGAPRNPASIKASTPTDLIIHGAGKGGGPSLAAPMHAVQGEKHHVRCRGRVTERLAAKFGDAAAGGRAGPVRELLSAQYPRLAQALEDTLAKLLQDTEVPPPALSLPGYRARSRSPLHGFTRPCFPFGPRSYPAACWNPSACCPVECCAPVL